VAVVPERDAVGDEIVKVDLAPLVRFGCCHSYGANVS
jgi:hypothetical protein